MLDYYCYVYYDADWVAYYVGKGLRNRRRVKRKIEVPPNERIQVFHFSEEWEAYECEIELISFFGRTIDGGTLQNVSTGGPGCPGVIPNDETRAKMSRAAKKRPPLIFTPEHRRKLSIAAKSRSPEIRAIVGRKCSEKLKGRKQSASHAKANGKAHAKPIALVHTITGEFRTFKSGKEASSILNLHPSSVAALRQGKLQTTSKWRLA